MKEPWNSPPVNNAFTEGDLRNILTYRGKGLDPCRLQTVRAPSGGEQRGTCTGLLNIANLCVVRTFGLAGDETMARRGAGAHAGDGEAARRLATRGTATLTGGADAERGKEDRGRDAAAAREDGTCAGRHAGGGGGNDDFELREAASHPQNADMKLAKRIRPLAATAGPPVKDL